MSKKWRLTERTKTLLTLAWLLGSPFARTDESKVFEGELCKRELENTLLPMLEKGRDRVVNLLDLRVAPQPMYRQQRQQSDPKLLLRDLLPLLQKSPIARSYLAQHRSTRS
jgi:hypothetical protein